MRRRAFLGALCAAGLTACGGGGGSESAQTGPLPTATISIDPSTIRPLTTTQITWSSTNATSCTASGAWNGARATSGTETSTLFSGDGPVSFLLSCTGPGGSVQASAVGTLIPGPPEVRFGTSRQSITAGSFVTLTWTTFSARDCTASGGWNGPRAPEGMERVGPILLPTMYTLSCTGAGGTTERSTSVTVTGPNLIPFAHAGQDQTVFATTLVQLTGTLSSDPGGLLEGFAWTQTAGPAVTLSGADQVFATFTAPAVSSTTLLTFRLVVTDDAGAMSAPDTVDITVQPAPAGPVTVSGRVTHQRVPFIAPPQFGLDYTVQAFEPSRGIVVEIVDAATEQILATTSTDSNGQYSFGTVPPLRNVRVWPRAEMRSPSSPVLPRWHFRVRDVQNNLPPFTYAGSIFNSVAGATHDVQIPSGWSSSGQVTNVPRPAAPFAILDTIYRSYNKILEVAPTADFPVLTIDWRANKPAGNTFYDRDNGGDDRRISLSGEVDVDIDEYDPHTIAHEFGHYIEDRFSRSDSIGGPHAAGDLLDMRVAFGEGFGYAFAAIVLNDPLVRDAGGRGQFFETRFSVETDSQINEGWFSEASNQETLWDLYDAGTEANDNVALGFAPIWQVVTTQQRTTAAATSVFPLVTALKEQNPGLSGQIDQIVGGEAIVATPIDAFGSAETNFPSALAALDVLPVYTAISIGGGPRTVRSNVPPMSSSRNDYNKLSNRRFLRLDVPPPGQDVRVTLTSSPGGRDPDIRIFREGVLVAQGITPDNENFAVFLNVGTYVLEVYDCANAGCGSPESVPGPVDLTVTTVPN